MMAHLGDDFFRRRYNIGIWAWELPRFPRRWHDRFAFYDEIWVGTSFIANALAPVCPLPVIRIPPVLTVSEQGSRAAGRSRLGVDQEFVFLFIFDLHSHLERKNPLAVIDAFKRAFAPSDRTRLVLKCVNADSESLAMMRERAQGQAVTIVDGYWPSTEIWDLMAGCDAYVSLHRSEGTGLTVSDAMALGKPVIATSWSGNMDFMTVANSFPVEYELVELERNVGPYSAGEVWANPSVEHAAEVMREVFEWPEEANQRGNRARQDLEAQYSARAVADLIGQRFDGIALRQQFPRFQEEAWSAHQQYQGLGKRIQEAVRQVAPPDATVMVVSKGDVALLDLEGRSAWHFPREESGAYAGYYPADSDAAIAHLESLRAAGGSFLVFPHTSLWWLESYPGLRAHLESHYRRVSSNQWCVIYALAATEHVGTLRHSVVA